MTKKCPYGEFTGICDITGKPCEDTVICNLETVYVKEEKENNCKYSGRPLVFAKEILNLLDIQEIEE